MMQIIAAEASKHQHISYASAWHYQATDIQRSEHILRQICYEYFFYKYVQYIAHAVMRQPTTYIIS